MTLMTLTIEFDKERLEELCLNEAKRLVMVSQLPNGEFVCRFNNKFYDPGFICTWKPEPPVEVPPVEIPPVEISDSF